MDFGHPCAVFISNGVIVVTAVEVILDVSNEMFLTVVHKEEFDQRSLQAEEG